MIDSHVHLDALPYHEGPGFEDVVRAAQERGVDRFVAPALHFASAQRLSELSRLYPQLYPAAGIHPHEVANVSLDDIARSLENALSANAVPIVGETGLEGHYDFAPLDLQLQSLREHLQVAKVHKIPIILHCRKTEQVLYDELQRAELSYPAVIHCYTGSWQWAERFLDLGCYIGITGIVTFKQAGAVAEVAAKIPLERLLVETDGPYLAPVPHRGRTNRPEYIPLIVEAIARLRGIAFDVAAQATTLNAEKFFRLAKPTKPG